MLELHYGRVWRGISIVLLITVLAATLMPAIWFWSDRVRLLSLVGGVDKWSHFAAFLVLALWFSGLFRKRSYWRVAVGLLAFGILIELCQRLVGYRSAEWLDVVANALGIAVGLFLGWLGFGGWCQRFEAWWLARRRPSS